MRAFPRFALGVVLALAASTTGCVTIDTSDRDRPPSQPAETADLAPDQVAGVPIPDGQIDDAIAQLDGLAQKLLDRTGIPGMAVAVVHDGETVYAKGFGVRAAGSDEPVDADTVFQLASMSKSIGATVVAQQVGAGVVGWDDPVIEHLPAFALAEPYVTEHVTVGDLYAHRSGLPDHAGDDLEDLGYDRAQILERLRLLPLSPFRITYDYTNFGVTTAAQAVADAAGADWTDLSQRVLYEPLGMNSTSSRFDDFTARDNRAPGHMLVDGEYVAREVRDPDEQSPAGGISSSVNDVAKWLTMLLADGQFEGRTVIEASALQPALSPQVVSRAPATPDSRGGFYGYGFNVGTLASGRTSVGHAGAFALGAATAFTAVPSADVAIVTLTNAAPIGVPDTLNAEFVDLVQFGEIRENWAGLYEKAYSTYADPKGSLVGQAPPTDPAPAKPLDEYAGVYDNPYFGPARIDQRDGSLVLTIGPVGQTYPLTHWDGDVFTFEVTGENAPDGTISTATFTPDAVTFEYWNTYGMGTFTRQGAS
ncbi:serine hydrolase [Rhodococcus sp. O3]|uniref:serine hydrolase n=1 Tax=Rhodococcus sp. O3 TaxID=3404919 RepID=UPI003B671B14